MEFETLNRNYVSSSELTYTVSLYLLNRLTSHHILHRNVAIPGSITVLIVVTVTAIPCSITVLIVVTVIASNLAHHPFIISDILNLNFPYIHVVAVCIESR
jgi:phosphotransferase system  glucose/maltose/N-acetylglucosamine-specific IIC component